MNEKKSAPIDKIKKLLSLSQSHNENEASVALAQAMKLAAAHGLEIKDIENSGGEEIQYKAISEYRQSVPKWEEILAVGLAEIFGCRIFFRHKSGRGYKLSSGKVVYVPSLKQVQVVGFPSDAEIFSYVHIYAKRALQEMGNRARYKSYASYMRGACWAVINNAQAIFKRDAMPEESAGFALILKRGGLIDKHLADVPKARTRNTEINAADYRAGYAAGEEIPLQRGIKAASAKKQALKNTALLN